MDLVARSAKARPLTCLQRWSLASNLGVAGGSNRTSLGSAVANSRESSAVCGEPRSSHSTIGHPRHCERIICKKNWWGLLIPPGGDEEQDIPRGDMEHARHDPPRAGPSKGDADLRTDSARTPIEWWSFRDESLVPHEEDRAEAASKPPGEPPVACRHVGEHRDRSGRGRFQRIPKRSNASLTRRWAVSTW